MSESMTIGTYVTYGKGKGFSNDSPLAVEITIDQARDQERDSQRWHHVVVDEFERWMRVLKGDAKTVFDFPIDTPMARNILHHIQRYTDLSRHVDSHEDVIKPLAESLWAHVSIIVFG